MLRGQTKGVSRAFTNPLRGENPEIKSRMLWASHPHIQNLYGLKEYKEQPKDGNSSQQTGEVKGLFYLAHGM
jgi:hypothetical protein